MPPDELTRDELEDCIVENVDRILATFGKNNVLPLLPTGLRDMLLLQVRTIAVLHYGIGIVDCHLGQKDLSFSSKSVLDPWIAANTRT